MSVQDEAAGVESVTFSCLGRDWSVPVKQRLSHKLALEAGLNRPYIDTDLMICRTFLSAEEFAALVALDPDEDGLDEMATAVGKAMGLGGSGNSSPSSAS